LHFIKTTLGHLTEYSAARSSFSHLGLKAKGNDRISPCTPALDARGRRPTARNARSRHENPRDRTKAKTDSVIGSYAKNCPEQTRSGTEGEGEMTIPRPQEWTKAEVHQLRMLAKRKVSADSIAKSLGRHVGSVKTKARELNLILSRKMKAKGK
jgi:hypothetical protein